MQLSLYHPHPPLPSLAVGEARVGSSWGTGRKLGSALGDYHLPPLLSFQFCKAPPHPPEKEVRVENVSGVILYVMIFIFLQASPIANDDGC